MTHPITRLSIPRSHLAYLYRPCHAQDQKLALAQAPTLARAEYIRGLYQQIKAMLVSVQLGHPGSTGFVILGVIRSFLPLTLTALRPSAPQSSFVVAVQVTQTRP